MDSYLTLDYLDDYLYLLIVYMDKRVGSILPQSGEISVGGAKISHVNNH